MSDKEKRPKRPRDINQRAASTVAIATGQAIEAVSSENTKMPEPTPEQQHVVAAMLGKKGGQARAKRLSPEQRKEIARKAAATRWHSSD